MATATLDPLEKRLRRRGGTTGGASSRRCSTATTATATASYSTSMPFATFSPISPAPVRVGEDEPPPSWDPIPTPKAMFGSGARKSVRSPVLANGSPKLRRLLAAAANASKKTYSPKCGGRKRSACSSSGGGVVLAKQRADWDADQEKSLVEILHKYNDSCYRSDNGWNTEGWNQMVKEFHERNKHVRYTGNQIQEKEGQLKRDYRMLKAARA
ncbi:hypothetical protein QOZ80_6BG0472600 [Eleusine coracana subsp. coracana]|nr:hypothetical protein QOZ80_6BG0472600 [Eleusine coracana subsp. coracana]